MKVENSPVKFNVAAQAHKIDKCRKYVQEWGKYRKAIIK